MTWRVCMAAFVVLGAASVSAYAQASPAASRRDVVQTSGPAVALSLGYQSPIVGGQVDYYVISPRRPLGFAVYLGGGWFPGVVIGGVQSERAFGPAAGVFAFWGHHHRLILDLSYGLAGMEGQAQGTVITRQDSIYGLTLAPGYEYMHRSGFFVRAGLGVTLFVGDIYVANQSRVAPTLNLALGMKIL